MLYEIVCLCVLLERATEEAKKKKTNSQHRQIPAFLSDKNGLSHTQSINIKGVNCAYRITAKHYYSLQHTLATCCDLCIHIAWISKRLLI